MRRALDGAILELGALNDRDKILDCFFEYGTRLFDFCVLFVVRGSTAHGRSVHGLGAPAGLVARLALSLDEPGILAKARATRKVFVAPGPSEEADHRLFGSLGRALPAPLVVPIVVRDRTVAIFVGEGASDTVTKHAADAGRQALDLVKEEMVLLAETAGQVLERLILRRKSGDSIPPKGASAPPPGLGDPAARPAIPRAAPLPAFVSPPPTTTDTAPSTYQPEWRPSRKVLLASVAGALITLLVVAGWWLTQPKKSSDRVVVAGKSLPGWPRIDPAATLDAARKAADLGANPDLTFIEAEVDPEGLVDFGDAATNPAGPVLRFQFVSESLQSDVVIDSRGVRAGHKQPRERCGGQPCQQTVPIPPTCSFPAIVTAAREVGLDEKERPFVRYAASVGEGAGAMATWAVTVQGRGTVRMDAESCKAFPRERFRPQPLPLEKIPGGPRVNPMDLVALARTQSGLEPDALLLEVEARGVTEGGRVDLSDPESGITFVFADPLGFKRRRWRQVTVSRAGMPITADEGDQTPLPVRLSGMIVPPPRCTFAQARDYLTRGIPGGVASARMTYGPDLASGQSGLWSLELTSLPSRRLVVDVECEAWVKINARK